MDPLIYKELVEQEDSHWWFLSRRAIIRSLLQRIKLPSNAKILDAGCGSGGNLPMLSRLGNVYAFELHDGMRAHAEARGIGQVEAGKLPADIPFKGTNFDLITLFDVLEHVEDDRGSLSELTDRLNPGGILCLTVPAFPFLFSRHDHLHHHFRRYRRTELLRKIEANGLEVIEDDYWNFFLFPVAMVVRLFECFNMPKDHTLGTKKPSPLLNRLLAELVSSDRFLIPHIRLPFGLSIVLLARKPAA
jgi:SAM-dependent methyltransferase